MGHRASFVILKDKQPHIYYSHWGALSIPNDIFYGPEATLEYIESLVPCERLLNDTFCEGAVLLDRDSKKVIFFGRDELGYSPAFRRHYIPMLEENYKGWQIEYAHQGIVDIANCIGYDLSEVESDWWYREMAFVPPENLIEPSEYNAGTIITVRYDENNIFDFSFAHPEVNVTNLLAVGPELIDHLKDRNTVSLPKETDYEYINDAAYIDVITKKIWVWWGEAISNRYLRKLSEFWPRWIIKRQNEGLVLHVEVSGRSGDLVRMKDEDIICEINRILKQDHYTQIREMTEQVAAIGSSVDAKINPYFTKYTRPEIDKKQKILMVSLVKHGAKWYFWKMVSNLTELANSIIKYLSGAFR